MLWSLFIVAENFNHSMQLKAESPQTAILQCLHGPGLSQMIQSAGIKNWPEDLGKEDIVLFMPMDGMINMFLCQAGRDGKYVTITIVLTAEDKLITSAQHV